MTTNLAESRDEAERVARQSYGRLVAFLSARSRDVAGAEDALSEAFSAALTDWPQNGVPKNPEAWLLTVARRRQMDMVRRAGTRTAAAGHLVLLAEELAGTGETDIPDERLRLMFACAHPAIDRKIRAPLILQTILGFDAATIGAAFLIPAATMGQRLVRAKTKIRDAGISFRLPDRADMPERLDTVLEAIYATFSEGWAVPSSHETRRRGLVEEAIWLCRLVVALLPDEPEALGLLALMLHLEARRAARRSEAGEYVPLADQDPAKWDSSLIDAAEDILLAAAHKGNIGRYQLEAAIQSVHANRRRGAENDWPMLEALYSHLLALTGSPVVAINRALVIAASGNTEAGLAALDAAGGDERLAAYQPYWAARADLLSRAGRMADADFAYGKAIAIETDAATRRFLEQRRQRIGCMPECDFGS